MPSQEDLELQSNSTHRTFVAELDELSPSFSRPQVQAQPSVHVTLPPPATLQNSTSDLTPTETRRTKTSPKDIESILPHSIPRRSFTITGDHAHQVYPENFDPSTFRMVELSSYNIYDHKWSIFGYLIFLLFCNLAIPCALYYPLKRYTNLHRQTLLGIASGSLGLSSCYDAPLRMYKLVRYRKLYGPLNDDVWWHLDAFMFAYQFALFVFAIPLAIAPAPSPPISDFFLMTTPCLVGPLGLVLFISLFQPTLLWWCSSDPKGTKMKPFVYYIVEDILAVDARYGREFRKAWADRYSQSPLFRDMIFWLTFWWAFGSAIFIGITAAVTWVASFDFAFGWVLGQLFVWALVWGIISIFITRYFLQKEIVWAEKEKKLRSIGKEKKVEVGTKVNDRGTHVARSGTLEDEGIEIGRAQNQQSENREMENINGAVI